MEAVGRNRWFSRLSVADKLVGCGMCLFMAGMFFLGDITSVHLVSAGVALCYAGFWFTYA